MIDYAKTILFGIYVFVLPISHTAAIQSISLGLFAILALCADYKNFAIKDILKIKGVLIVFAGLLILSYFRIFFRRYEA